MVTVCPPRLSRFLLDQFPGETTYAPSLNARFLYEIAVDVPGSILGGRNGNGRLGLAIAFPSFGLFHPRRLAQHVRLRLCFTCSFRVFFRAHVYTIQAQSNGLFSVYPIQAQFNGLFSVYPYPDREG